MLTLIPVRLTRSSVSLSPVSVRLTGRPVTPSGSSISLALTSVK